MLQFADRHMNFAKRRRPFAMQEVHLQMESPQHVVELDGSISRLFYFSEFLAGPLGLINPVIAIFAALATWCWCLIGTQEHPNRYPFLIILNGPLVTYMLFLDHVIASTRTGLQQPYPSLAIPAASAGTDLSGNTHLRRLSYRRLRWVSVSHRLSFYISLCNGAIACRCAVPQTTCLAGRNSQRRPMICANAWVQSGSQPPTVASPGSLPLN